MGKICKLAVMVCLVTMLSGCNTSPRYADNYNETSVLQVDKNVSLLKGKLSLYGVKVYQDNNSLKIMLPNKVFFNENSANLRGEAYEALDLIYNLSNYYKGSTIAVIGYAKDDNEIEHALATERACKISKQLWAAKINSNFVYAEGMSAGTAEEQLNYTVVEFK